MPEAARAYLLNKLTGPVLVIRAIFHYLVHQLEARLNKKQSAPKTAISTTVKMATNQVSFPNPQADWSHDDPSH